jgi:hypothetical protein
MSETEDSVAATRPNCRADASVMSRPRDTASSWRFTTRRNSRESSW